MCEIVKGGIYSPSFNFADGVVILLPVRACQLNRRCLVFFFGRGLVDTPKFPPSWKVAHNADQKFPYADKR